MINGKGFKVLEERSFMCWQEAKKRNSLTNFGYLFILGRILTACLKLRGLQANQEFFALLRTEGPRYQTDEIVSCVPAVSGREEL